MSKQKHYGIILILLAVLALSGLFIFLYITNLFITSVEKRGRADILQLTALLEEGGASFQEIVRRQSSFLDAEIIIIDAESHLRADSRKISSDLKGQYIDADISEAKKKGHTLSTRRDHRTGDFLITIARRVGLSSSDIVISIIYRNTEIGRLSRALVIFLVVLSILILVLIFAYSRISVLQYRNPLREFLKLTESAGGGMHRISAPSDNPEFLLLAEQFNNQIDRYNHLILSDNRKYSRINTLLAHLKTGMLMVDTDNVIVMVNSAGEQMLHLNKLRLFKIRDKGRYSNEILDMVIGKCREVNGSLESESLSITSPDGLLLEISIDAVFSKYEPNEHSGALVILQDVTEIRRLEKLKDDFVANVSHELKTPLTIINGFVETLKSWDNIEPEDRNTALNIIDIETQRLKKLISELLLLSRINGEMGEARRKMVDPGLILKDVITTMTSRCSEKNITTELVIQEELEAFDTVPGWFRQIIVNLYDNALKYSPPGATVTLSLSDVSSDSPDHEKNLVLRVCDTGMGISKGDGDRIFDRFYRGEKRKNRNISGSGLGLTIVRHMADELGGSIKVDSEKGKGSCFTVLLPRKIKDNEK